MYSAILSFRLFWCMGATFTLHLHYIYISGNFVYDLSSQTINIFSGKNINIKKYNIIREALNNQSTYLLQPCCLLSPTPKHFPCQVCTGFMMMNKGLHQVGSGSTCSWIFVTGLGYTIFLKSWLLP